MNNIFFANLAVLISLAVSAAAGDSTTGSLQKQAEAGDAAAQFQLGRLYFRGEGVAKDEKAALAWIEKSAAQGNTDAITSMGYFYSKGAGVPKDEKKAVEWFRRGAEAGSATCKLNLGLLLRQGETIQLSNDESLRLMHEAAMSGSAEANSYLGRLYFMGDRLLKPDYAKARPYALKAAEAGDSESQNIMGLLCRDGVASDAGGKDIAEAERWFRRAAEQDNVKAMANLAHLMGVASLQSANRVEALKWLLIAKDRNEPTATKTYDEIAPTISPELEQEARSKATIFMLQQAAVRKAEASPKEQ
jgi:hypothetical protein